MNDGTPRRRLLVVTYPYPPMPSVGSNRWAAMTKYLRRLGHEVSVITTSAFGGLADDRASGVVRTTDLLASSALRRVLRRPPLPAPGRPAETDRPPPGILMRVLVPDPYLATWVPMAAVAARRLVREREVDCLVTSTPYESTHLVGLALGRGRPAWIADFRDPWSMDRHRPPFPTRLQERLDQRLEARIVREADAAVTLSRPVVEDFRARLGVETELIPNGWDPDLDRELGSTQIPKLDPRRLSLVYTGTLSGGWGRAPGALLEALRLVEERIPGRLELVVAGRLTSEEERLLAGAELADVVRHVGHLSRAEAAALQRRADALVLVTSRNVSEFPGKLIEYLAAGRPILALAAGTEAGRIVNETRTGTVVAPDDPNAIAGALRRALDGQLGGAYDPRGLERYLYPVPATAMANLVERAIARRAARG